MRSVGWRVMASGFAVACFGLSLVACDDDTSKTNDMAMNPDMAVQDDLAVPGPDMAVSKATARVLLADVTGNAYTNPSDPNMVTGAGHILSTLVTFPPGATPPSDYVEPGFSSTSVLFGNPDGVRGCVADRYSLIPAPDAGAPKVPVMDEDVGTLVMSGYNANALAVEPGSSPPSPPTFAKVPPTIQCARTSGYYACAFGATDGGSAFTGIPTSKAFFPSALPGIPVNDPLAEGAAIMMTAPGGGDYPSAINLPNNAPTPLRIASLKKNGTDVAGIDQIGTLTATDSIEIGWSCDPNSGTVGAGCPTMLSVSTALDFVVIVMVTSGTPRNNFTGPGVNTPRWGTVSCFHQTAKGTTPGAGGNKRATVTIPAGAIATMIGQNPTVENKSYQIAVIRVTGSPGMNNGHTVFGAVGQGVFGLNSF